MPFKMQCNLNSHMLSLITEIRAQSNVVVSACHGRSCVINVEGIMLSISSCKELKFAC